MIRKKTLALLLLIVMISMWGCGQEPIVIEPDITTEDPLEIETPELPEGEEPEINEAEKEEQEQEQENKETTNQGVTYMKRTILNTTIQNEANAKEKLMIQIAKADIESLFEKNTDWSKIKLVESSTKKVLLSRSKQFYDMLEIFSFLANNKTQIHTSFDCEFEIYDKDGKVIDSKGVTIYTYLTKFWLGWQNREGKTGSFELLKENTILKMCSDCERYGASDCAMRFLIRVPYGESVTLSTTSAVISGSQPITLHYRLDDYNLEYRNPLHPLPDDPILHYDIDNSNWISAKNPYKMSEGLHIIHVVPDSPDFDESEIVVIVTRKLEDGSEKTYGASCYYVPENMELLKDMLQETYENQNNQGQEKEEVAPY